MALQFRCRVTTSSSSARSAFLCSMRACTYSVVRWNETDLVTRLRFKGVVDMSTRAYARLGFRTERLSPTIVVEGFTA